MKDDCLFGKIIAGEIPSYKVYEDDKFFAFLDINPINLGHTLLVPKEHYGNILDMPYELYVVSWQKARELAPSIKKATDAVKIGFEVEGFGVPHTHLHIIPLYEPNQIDPHNQKPADPEELAAMAGKIKTLIDNTQISK